MSRWPPASCSTRWCGGANVVIIIGGGLLGLCFGRFLNVCILRLPRDQSLLKARSTCPNCKQPIAWRDNIPLFSWLWLRGKCRWCQKPISKQYPLIEALVGLLFGASVLAYGSTLHAVAAALFGTILLGIAITDARHYLIPDEFTWGGLVIGLLLALGGGVDGFLQALLGAAVGFVLLWLVGMAGGGGLDGQGRGGGGGKKKEGGRRVFAWRGGVRDSVRRRRPRAAAFFPPPPYKG